MDTAPRKSLGQHWLVSEAHIRKIVDAVGDVGGVAGPVGRAGDRWRRGQFEWGFVDG